MLPSHSSFLETQGPRNAIPNRFIEKNQIILDRFGILKLFRLQNQPISHIHVS